MSTSTLHSVTVCEYAKSHFIKSFQKKYKQAWDDTFLVLENMLSRIDSFVLTAKTEKIHICDSGYIAKCEFKIAGSHISTKTAGNRIIVYGSEEKKETHILLLYAKTDIKGRNETAWWTREIKNNHKNIAVLFSGL